MSFARKYLHLTLYLLISGLISGACSQAPTSRNVPVELSTSEKLPVPEKAPTGMGETEGQSPDTAISRNEGQNPAQNLATLQGVKPGPTKEQGSYLIDKSSRYLPADAPTGSLFVVDLNGDGRADLVTLGGPHSTPLVYYFKPAQSKFVLAEKNPFPEGVSGTYLNFMDYDGDNLPDVLVSNVPNLQAPNSAPKQKVRFFKGVLEQKQFKFEEVQLMAENGTGIPELMNPQGQILVMDFDNDGKLDFFLTGTLRLFKGGALFKTITKGPFAYQLPWKESPAPEGLNVSHTERLLSLGASTCNLTGKETLDLWPLPRQGGGPHLWWNTGSRFTLDQVNLLLSNQQGSVAWEWGTPTQIICRDQNLDGRADVVISSISSTQNPIINPLAFTSVLWNLGENRFRLEHLREESVNSLSVPTADRRALSIDLNLDGVPEVLLENSGHPPFSRLQIFEQVARKGDFPSFKSQEKIFGGDILNPASIVGIDLNQDGRPDLLSSQTNVRYPGMKVQLWAFENQFPWQGSKGFKVYLRGQKSNRWGLGAQVTLKTNKHTYVQTHGGLDGAIPAQSEEGLWFHIMKNEVPQSLEVRWPYFVHAGAEKKGSFLVGKYPLHAVWVQLQTQNSIKLTLCEGRGIKIGLGVCR